MESCGHGRARHLLSALAVVALAGCPSRGPAVRLAVQLDAGDELRVVQEAHQEVTGGPGSAAGPIAQDSRVQILLEVREGCAGGGCSVQATWEAVEISIRTASRTVRWDSRGGGQLDAAFQSLSSLPGERIRFDVSAEGTVSGIEGSAAELLAPEAANLFCPLPAGAVRPGDSWETELRAPLGAGARGRKVRAHSRWTLVSRAAGVSTVRVVTTVEATGEQDSAGAQVTGGGTGTYEVEEATGRIVTARVEQDLTVSLPAAQGRTPLRVKRVLRTRGELSRAARPTAPSR